VYFVITSDAKSEAFSAMKNKNTVLEKLELDKTAYSNIKWTEGHKEFSYNGQLYDMVSVAKIGAIYSVLVYADKNETQWVKALDNFMKELFPSDNTKANKNVESITSALQKEYLPLNKLSIVPPDATYTIRYSNTLNIYKIPATAAIWHPPAIS
ncbi:MAG TPA: hypothetical protein VNY36_08240, partial [Bacteroidia bacterium]|nr:hypothetical protein [Bacteroidia bacterium]